MSNNYGLKAYRVPVGAETQTTIEDSHITGKNRGRRKSKQPQKNSIWGSAGGKSGQPDGLRPDDYNTRAASCQVFFKNKFLYILMYKYQFWFSAQKNRTILVRFHKFF